MPLTCKLPKHRSPARSAALVCRAIGVCLGLLPAAVSAWLPAAETKPWDLAPYRIEVWLAIADDSPLASQQSYLEQVLRERADVRAGAAWLLEIKAPPPNLRTDVLLRPESISPDAILSAAEEVMENHDKLILLSVTADEVRGRIRARELDCRTRSWGPVQDREVRQPQRLAWDAANAMCDAFFPVARIEDVRGKEAIVRVRARGLIYGESSPAEIKVGDVLQPIIRMNNRAGKPLINGIVTVPWTYLHVVSEERLTQTCQVYSGRRGALGGRASSRIERFARAVRPQSDSSELLVRTRGENSQPLAGYEIYAKNPLLEQSEQGTEPEKQTPAERLGVTDWRGLLEVPPGDFPLRILYVKSGNQLLARVPMVPGWEPRVESEVPDDDKRLQAEGFVKGIQATVLDIVSRRELYKARIRRQISQNKLDEAQELLDELRAMQTREQLLQFIASQQARMSDTDRSAQARIDRLFSDARNLVSRFVDARAAEEMSREVAQARQGGG